MSTSEQNLDDGCYKPPSPEEDLKFIKEHPIIRSPPQFKSDGDYIDSRILLNPDNRTRSYEDTHLRVSPILPSLYLSDVYTATSPTVLSNLGITHIVSVIELPRRDDYPHMTGALEILHIQLDDYYSTEIEEYFDSSSAWIQEALANGESKVLVHCAAGRSRSPTIVIAYLMAMKGMSYETALSHVRERRKGILPNFGFVRQLEGLERRLNGTECTDAKPVERHGLRSTISCA